MSAPVLRKSRSTTTHQCRAAVCRHEGGAAINHSSFYVGISVPAKPNALDYFKRRQLCTMAFHVECFQAEYPERPLTSLKGYARHGDAVVRSLSPARSLWEHLELE